MTKRIVYPRDDGGIAEITPVLECGLTLEEIAAKDVPAGKPFRIVDVAELPSDYTFFNAWEADFSNPDGHGIGHEAWFAEQGNSQ